MCGRFYNHVSAMHRWAELLQDWPADASLSYNITPTQSVPIIKEGGAVAARWGLIPGWAKTFESAYATHNARIETVAEKPAFRSAWKANRVCVVPAAGYYEWRTEDERKQPYAVHKPDDLLMLAGIWEPWQDNLSFTILTEAAKGKLADLHHRMPIMLDQNQVRAWMKDGTAANIQSEIYQDLEYYAVSRKVGSPKNNSEELIKPID